MLDSNMNTSKQRNNKESEKKMNLFNVYEAALEATEQNDLVFDAQYIIDYVDGAFDSFIPESLAQKIIDAHNEWLDSEQGSHNKFVILQQPLEEFEIIV